MIENKKFSFRIVSVEKLENIIISYEQLEKFIDQVVLLIQAFILHQEHLQEEKGSSELEAIEKNCELEALKEILTYLENSINYNYEVACIECEKKRKRKKNDMMGLGESGIVQAARIKMV